MFELVYDYQFKSSRYSYGSIYLNSRVTTDQKHITDSQRSKERNFHVLQNKTIRPQWEKKKKEQQKHLKNKESNGNKYISIDN